MDFLAFRIRQSLPKNRIFILFYFLFQSLRGDLQNEVYGSVKLNTFYPVSRVGSMQSKKCLVVTWCH